MALLTRAAVMELFGITEDAANAECHCGHHRWEHNDGAGTCLHADFVGDYGEYNDWCRCNSFVDNLPKMRELTTVGTFVFIGRGIGHSVYVGDTPPEVGEHVILDGESCVVTGVEWPVSSAGYTTIVVAPAAQ